MKISNERTAAAFVNGNFKEEIARELLRGTKKQVAVRIRDVHEILRGISHIEAVSFFSWIATSKYFN